ncbi:MAG: protoporphyrinogen oxidase [Thermomicrobiales bacterium]
MRLTTPDARGSGQPRIVVAGGGISGLAAAYRLTTRLPQAEVVVLEQADRLGGKIITEQRDGFVIEGGPEALLTAKPVAAALCAELGLVPDLHAPRPEARRSYILRDGQLRPLPDGLGNLLPTRLWPLATTPLISPLGKLRMGLDLVLPRRDDADADDESLGHFIERRLGREAYTWLVSPLVGGIYAADGYRLSLAATFPHLRKLEQEHGGMIRATLAARRQAPPTTSARPAPMQAPQHGLTQVVDALAARLQAAGARIATGSAVRAVHRQGQGYALTLATGETMWADAVICAAPAPAAATVLDPLDTRLAELLRGIPHASVATLALAYSRQVLPSTLMGSGYLTPRTERRPVKACTWVSAKWAGRAPVDASLIRVSFGGAGMDKITELSDDDLLRLAQEELRAVLGITAQPCFTRLFRWPQAMPQYEPGHLERLAGIDARLEGYPNLALAGNAYRGVGLADCVQSGEQAADRLMTYFATHGGAARHSA